MLGKIIANYDGILYSRLNYMAIAAGRGDDDDDDNDGRVVRI